MAFNPDQERDDKGRWAPSGAKAAALLDAMPRVEVPSAVYRLTATTTVAPVAEHDPALASDPSFNDFDLVGLANSASSFEDGDPGLNRMWQARGFDGRPTVASPDEFARTTQGMTVLYRGINGDTQKQAERYAEEYRTAATSRAGIGVQGGGTDTTTDPANADNHAADLTGSQANGTVMRMAIPADANIVQYDDMRAARATWEKSWNERLAGADPQQAQSLQAQRALEERVVVNPGRHATALGYQAVARTYPDGTQDYVIQDRSVLVVEAG